MKEKILKKSIDMFLNYGFKSVTMDDISQELGISKKTIYSHYKNKSKLVEATTLLIFETISTGINCICELGKNPIEELYAIKRFVMEHLKNEKTSPQYQLQKYYPELYKSLKIKQLEVMEECVIDNLKRGVEQGEYREGLDFEFIARLYFNGMNGIKDRELFSNKKHDAQYLLENYLQYHIRAIATKKGLQTMEKILINNEN